MAFVKFEIIAEIEVGHARPELQRGGNVIAKQFASMLTKHTNAIAVDVISIDCVEVYLVEE